MHASVIVPAYNAEKTIRQCLKALLQQDFPKEQYEIIVVDDGSRDRTAEVAMEYPVRVMRQKHTGPAAARNKGAKITKGEILVFIDADCKSKDNCLSTLVGNFNSPDIAGVGGSYETGNKNYALARIIGYEIAIRHKRMPRFVDYLGGFNCAYRKDVFQKADGFDESFIEASGEDNDLSYRIFDMGYRLVFEPKAVVMHNHSSRLIDYLRKQYQHAMWRVKLYRKHPKKIKGDIYVGVMSLIVQSLFYIAFILTLVTSLFWREALLMSIGLLALLFLAYLPITFKMYGESRDPISFLAPLIFFLRGFARILGLIVGIMKFLIFEGLQDSGSRVVSSSKTNGGSIHYLRTKCADIIN